MQAHNFCYRPAGRAAVHQPYTVRKKPGLPRASALGAPSLSPSAVSTEAASALDEPRHFLTALLTFARFACGDCLTHRGKTATEVLLHKLRRLINLVRHRVPPSNKTKRTSAAFFAGTADQLVARSGATSTQVVRECIRRHNRGEPDHRRAFRPSRAGDSAGD